MRAEHRTPEGALKRSLKRSLERLGADYVNLYLMRSLAAFNTESIKVGNLLCVPTLLTGKLDLDIEDWNFVTPWELIRKLMKAGSTNAVGVSNFSINHLREAFASPGFKKFPVCNEVEIHQLLLKKNSLMFLRKSVLFCNPIVPLIVTMLQF